MDQISLQNIHNYTCTTRQQTPNNNQQPTNNQQTINNNQPTTIINQQQSSTDNNNNKQQQTNKTLRSKSGFEPPPKSDDMIDIETQNFGDFFSSFHKRVSSFRFLHFINVLIVSKFIILLLSFNTVFVFLLFWYLAQHSVEFF